LVLLSPASRITIYLISGNGDIHSGNPLIASE
jgi:hypothetical protein